MAYRVQFTQKSVDDLDAIIEFYFLSSEKAAEEIYGAIIARAESLEELAERGRMVPELLDEDIRHIRELIEGHFRIIYRINGRFVEILRIVDTRQLLKMNID